MTPVAKSHSQISISLLMQNPVFPRSPDANSLWRATCLRTLSGSSKHIVSWAIRWGRVAQMHVRRATNVGVCHRNEHSYTFYPFLQNTPFPWGSASGNVCFAPKVSSSTDPIASVSLGKKETVMTSCCCVSQQTRLFASLLYMPYPSRFTAERASSACKISSK